MQYLSAKLLKESAKNQNYAVEALKSNDEFFTLTSNSGTKILFKGSRPSISSANGVDIVKSKLLCLDFVNTLGINVPDYMIHQDVTESLKFISDNKKIVVKPVFGSESIGVTVGITNKEELTSALELACSYSSDGKAVLQRQLEGNLYRVIVINGKHVNTTQRSAAVVVGDGKHTVRELIEELNKDPRRGTHENAYHGLIDITKSTSYLGVDSINSILPKDDTLRVTEIDSISEGGDAVNVTEQTHQYYKEYTERITAALGLFIAGFDIITPDISVPPTDGVFPLLEINSKPGLKMHHYPTKGEPADVASIIISEAFDYAMTNNKFIIQ